MCVLKCDSTLYSHVFLIKSTVYMCVEMRMRNVYVLFYYISITQLFHSSFRVVLSLPVWNQGLTLCLAILMMRTFLFPEPVEHGSVAMVSTCILHWQDLCIFHLPVQLVTRHSHLFVLHCQVSPFVFSVVVWSWWLIVYFPSNIRFSSLFQHSTWTHSRDEQDSKVYHFWRDMICTCICMYDTCPKSI